MLLDIDTALLHLGIEEPTPAQSLLITALIPQVQGIISAYCGVADIEQSVINDPDAPDSVESRLNALRYVANYLLAVNFYRITDGRTGVKEESFNSIATKYADDALPPLITRLLQPFISLIPG